MDGDGSYNPKGIIDMLKLIDDYDFVCCSGINLTTKVKMIHLFALLVIKYLRSQQEYCLI